MYVYVYVCICICMYMYIYINNIYINIYAQYSTHINLHLHLRLPLHLHLNYTTYVCTCNICMYVCKSTCARTSMEFIKFWGRWHTFEYYMWMSQLWGDLDRALPHFHPGRAKIALPGGSSHKALMHPIEYPLKSPDGCWWVIAYPLNPIEIPRSGTQYLWLWSQDLKFWALL